MASLTARELVLCTLLGGVLLNWTVGQLMRAPEAPATRRLGQRAWLLVVRLQFKSKADVAAFLAIFAPMADAVSSHEPDTWGYTVSRSDQDSLALMIFERYATKDAYLSVHKAMKHFMKFRPKLQAMQDAKQVEVTGESFTELGVGFM